MSMCDRERATISRAFPPTNYIILSVPPIPQIVFYQAGVGTEHNFYQSLLDGVLAVYFSRSHLP